jgi:lipoprotein-releasing system permease protein
VRQPYELAIALRYLRTRAGDSFISFISLVSMVGIGLAVAVLIVVLSVMNGFENELEQRILSVVSHASVNGYEQTMDDWQAARELALQDPRIEEAAPFVAGQGLVVNSEQLVGVNLRGIVPEFETRVARIAELMTQGRLEALAPGAYGVVIGSSLAAQLGVGVGDRVVFVVAQGMITPAGLVPRMRQFEVVGVFHAGMYEYDRGLVFTHLEDASVLFRTGGEATGLRLAVEDIYRAGETATALALSFGGGYYVSDWTRQHVNFFRSIQQTKIIMFIILTLVIGVAAFNIVSTLVMVVQEKRGDIAILRSFGTLPRSIMAIFTSQGALIGLLGTAFGVVLGVALASELGTLVELAERWLGTDLLAEDVYFVSDLPTQVRAPEVLQIALLAFVLALLATVYPAWSASRLPPAEALRHE